MATNKEAARYIEHAKGALNETKNNKNETKTNTGNTHSYFWSF